MKTYILIYKDFAHFEVILSSYFLKTKGEIVTVGLSDQQVTSVEGFNIVPHMSIADVAVEDVDVFIIPGGEPANISGCSKLCELIIKLNENNKIIGAICSGVLHLARAGILNNRNYTTSLDLSEYNDFPCGNFIDTNVVVDNNLITAKASGYVDFAIELGKLAEIYEDEADLKETIDFFKYFRS